MDLATVLAAARSKTIANTNHELTKDAVLSSGQSQYRSHALGKMSSATCFNDGIVSWV